MCRGWLIELYANVLLVVVMVNHWRVLDYINLPRRRRRMYLIESSWSGSISIPNSDQPLSGYWKSALGLLLMSTSIVSREGGVGSPETDRQEGKEGRISRERIIEYRKCVQLRRMAFTCRQFRRDIAEQKRKQLFRKGILWSNRPWFRCRPWDYGKLGHVSCIHLWSEVISRKRTQWDRKGTIFIPV